VQCDASAVKYGAKGAEGVEGGLLGSTAAGKLFFSLSFFSRPHHHHHQPLVSCTCTEGGGTPRGRKHFDGDLSFHFYDFPRTLWRAWKEGHVYEGFQMALLTPTAFLLSSWPMKD